MEKIFIIFLLSSQLVRASLVQAQENNSKIDPRVGYAVYVFPTKSTYYESHYLMVDFPLKKNFSTVFSIGFISGENRNIDYFINAQQISTGLRWSFLKARNFAFRPSLQLTYYSFGVNKSYHYRGGGLKAEFIAEYLYKKMGFGIWAQSHYTLGRYNGLFVPQYQVSHGYFPNFVPYHFGLLFSYKF